MKRKSKNWYLRRCKEHALSKGGECLSDEYIRGRDLLKWICAEGHIWPASSDHVINQKSWCRECANNKRRKSIEEIRNWLKKNRNAELLSKEYVNCDGKLKIRCQFGHEFPMSWSNIFSGGFCKKCSSGISERICRNLFEEIFKTTFENTFPKTLLGNHNRSLELDGYAENVIINNKIYKIAFEHQGKQHYEKIQYFSQNEESFNKRQEYDEIKRNWCRKEEIILIEIPELFTKTKLKDLIVYIKKEFENYNIKINKNIDMEKVIKKSWLSPNNIKHYNIIKQIVENRGGELLSKEFVSNRHPIKIKCKRNHIFDQIPNELKKGRFCEKCGFFEHSFYSRGFFKQKKRFHISFRGKYICSVKNKIKAFYLHKIISSIVYNSKNKTLTIKEIKEKIKKEEKENYNFWIEKFQKDKKLMKVLEEKVLKFSF